MDLSILRTILLPFIITLGLWATDANAQYFTENFEAPFSGSGATAAPVGWSQSSFSSVGNTSSIYWAQGALDSGVWGPIDMKGDEPTLTHSGGVSGKALVIDDANLTPEGVVIRRIVSGSISTSGAVNPYVKFFYAAKNAASVNNVRLIGSSDGGANWIILKHLSGHGTVDAAAAGLSNGWGAIHLKLPTEFVGNPTIKIGFENSSSLDSNAYLIDDVTIEEFTPTTITSVGDGHWNDPNTWSGGVIPTAANHVVISAGDTVRNAAEYNYCQDLTVAGILINLGSRRGYLRVMNDLTIIHSGIVFNAAATDFNATGRLLSVGRNVINNGKLVCQSHNTSNHTLFFNGCGGSNYSGTGILCSPTMSPNGQIAVLICANSGGVSFSKPVRNPVSLGLVNGSLDATNLTIGLGAAHATVVLDGTMAAPPTTYPFAIRSLVYGGMSARAHTIAHAVFWGITPPKVKTPGFELNGNGGNAVNGVLVMNTANNLQLNAPITIGRTSAGGLTLQRGLIISSDSSLLTLNCGPATFEGTAPGIGNPNPVSQGSYVVGPLRMIFPTSGTTPRLFPLGRGSALNPVAAGSTPSSNRYIPFQVTGGKWKPGRDFTARILDTIPSGPIMAPATYLNSVICYRLKRNGNDTTDLPNAARITLTGNNYTFGNSDFMLFGYVKQLAVLQASSTTGPWAGRTRHAPGSTAINPNTNYSVTSDTLPPGSVAPLMAKGEYFAIGTTDTGAGNLSAKTSLITGHTRAKAFVTCNPDSTVSIPGVVIKAMPGPYYALSNSNGSYNLRLPVAMTTTPVAYILSGLPYSPFHTPPVCPAGNVYPIVLNSLPDTLPGKDFIYLSPLCHNLSVQMASGRRKRCLANTTVVSYLNTGHRNAPDAFVVVEYPQWVRPISASMPHIALNDSTWKFELDTVRSGQSGMITLVDSVRCAAPLHYTLCTKASIFPPPDCPSNPGWNGAEVLVSGKCDHGIVHLGIFNTGTGDMSDSVDYSVFMDSIQVRTGKVKLASGDSLKMDVHAHGMTVTLSANQVTNHPTEAFVTTTLEGCSGTTLSLPHATLQHFPISQTPIRKIHCLPVVESNDSNDKQAFPIGFTSNHVVKPGTQMEYLVRFQNTGNDTAFTVNVIDSLDNNLDPESIEVGAVSHPYELSMQTTRQGRTFLRFQFDNIWLPDSNTSELRSHGFIQYRISPKAGISLGAQAKNEGAIYFDFNPPVLTNQTLTTFDNLVFTNPGLSDSVHVVVPTKTTLSLKQLGVKLYPNPVTQNQLTVSFSTNGSIILFNAGGQAVYSKENMVGTSTLPLLLRSGIYMARISTEKGMRMEKVVVMD